MKLEGRLGVGDRAGRVDADDIPAAAGSKLVTYGCLTRVRQDVQQVRGAEKSGGQPQVAAADVGHQMIGRSLPQRRRYEIEAQRQHVAGLAAVANRPIGPDEFRREGAADAHAHLFVMSGVRA